MMKFNQLRFSLSLIHLKSWIIDFSFFFFFLVQIISMHGYKKLHKLPKVFFFFSIVKFALNFMIFFRFWIDLFGSRENGEEKDF